jgi:hypothetical protein
MGEPPKGMCLDRKDNDGDYSPENCHWTTQKVQQRNRRNNVRFTYRGKSLLLSEWSELTGIKRSTLSMRIYARNWTIAKAVTTPVLERRIEI